MSDPELEALRKQRMAQLQSQYNVSVTKFQIFSASRLNVK